MTTDNSDSRIEDGVLELDNVTLEQGETEFRADDDWEHVSAGVYLRVEEVYATDNGEFVAFSHDGAGPEIDVPVEKVENALGTALVQASRDAHMHD